MQECTALKVAIAKLIDILSLSGTISLEVDVHLHKLLSALLFNTRCTMFSCPFSHATCMSRGHALSFLIQ